MSFFRACNSKADKTVGISVLRSIVTGLALRVLFWLLAHINKSSSKSNTWEEDFAIELNNCLLSDISLSSRLFNMFEILPIGPFKS